MVIARAVASFLVVTLLTPSLLAADWKAGAAKVVITPDQPLWMSGYASRTHPADGKVHDLWAKSLVIEDPVGRRVAIITLDLVGIDRQFSLAVRDAIRERHGLDHAHVSLCCSHTHSGPVVGTTLMPMYFLSTDQQAQVERYTAALQQKLIALVGSAIEQLGAVQISWGVGRAEFAVNRRNNPEADVPRLRVEGNLKGPVDHDVPVLAIHDANHQLRAVLCGYACHATVLDGYQWCGDYPGFAQNYLEQSHPGAIALFFAGCGADQNPIPRRQIELADQYGRRLSDAVDRTLSGDLELIDGELSASYSELGLPFASIPSEEQLRQTAESKDRYEASRAQLLLAQLKTLGTLSPTYPYPVQVWRLGAGPTLIMLGGEVVVDYALRLKQTLGPRTTWVAGYANDVMAYIPSRRVLIEGRYEGGGAMVYYGLPSPWAPQVEELIVRRVEQLAQPAAADKP